MKENNNEVNEMNRNESIYYSGCKVHDTDFILQKIDELLKKDELTKKIYESMIKVKDGEPVNKNPLSEIPEPDMRLYSIGNDYFESIDELLKFCRKKHKTSEGLTVLDYYKNLAGRSDVIRKSNSQLSILYTAVDKDGYGMYNNTRSAYRGEFIWDYNYGSIRDLYKPFKERGIDFVIDVYGKIDESEQNVLRYFKENNLFNMGQNN